MLVLLDKLPGARGIGFHNVVPKKHGERLITDEVAGAPYGVAKPLGFLLADVMKVDVRRFSNLCQNIELSLFLQRVFQLKGNVEVVLNCPFSFACYDNNVLNAGLDGFFYNVLNGGLINDREHLFRHRFRCRQKSCT
ncbi:hypothetical protein D3C75_689760 [compost metagenome]